MELKQLGINFDRLHANLVFFYSDIQTEKV